MAIAESASEGQAAVLARLGRDPETQVVIPTAGGDISATLYWRDGYIEAEASMPGRLEAYHGHIGLPATVMTALVGRQLGDVAALPFRLPTPVQNVEENSDS